MAVMSTKPARLLHTIAILAAGFIVCAPALADGNSHARGNGGSFSSRGGGNQSSTSNRGGGRSDSGARGSMRSGRDSGSSQRGSYGGGNRGSYTTRGDGGSSSRGSFRSDRGSIGNTARAPGGVTGNVARTPPASTVRDGGSNRGNSRPGFSTTRPDFGTSRPGVSRPNVGTDGGAQRGRPGLSTRPDFNGRNNFNSNGRDPNRDWNRDGRRDGNGRYYDRRPGYDGRYSNGRYYGRPGYHSRYRWHGGHWNGLYWPRVYYRPGFVSFWPVLPIGYSTYWFGGESYYYVNDLYYTWSPARYGYVLTDPPPAVETTASSESGNAEVEAEDESGSASVYVYPRNGQSEEQTANDRFECHQWAVSQTGFDPTTANGADPATTSSGPDYRRALIACLDARGYSAN